QNSPFIAFLSVTSSATPSAPSPSTPPGGLPPWSPSQLRLTKIASFPPARSTPTGLPSWPMPSQTRAATTPTSSRTSLGRVRTAGGVGWDTLTTNTARWELAIVVVADRRSLSDNSQTVLMQFQPKEVAF